MSSRIIDRDGNEVEVPHVGEGGGGSTPTLAEVLAAGNVVPDISVIVGPAPYVGGSPAMISPSEAELSLTAADGGPGMDAPESRLIGGSGDGGQTNPGIVHARGGLGDGSGGNVELASGDANFGTGKNGGDVILTPGAGDGAGAHGKIVLGGPVDYGSNAPTLAEVLAAGNDPGVTHPSIKSTDDPSGPSGGSVDAVAATPTVGGFVSVKGGYSVNFNGAGITYQGGNDDQSRGGHLILQNGGSGGQTILDLSTLPTSDPGVPGALYSDGVPSAGVPKAIMVSGG